MIPDSSCSWGPGKHGETALFEALRANLSDEFFVYYNLCILERDTASEGEADFLVLHKQHGILVIECKGKGVCRTGDGTWSKIIDGRRWPMKESPFQQAQRTVKLLMGELESRTLESALSLPAPLPFLHGHAVAFPVSILDDLHLPLDAQRAILIDAKDLAGINGKIQQIYTFWSAARKKKSKPLSDREFKKFRKHILHPSLNITESLGAMLQLDDVRFHRMTQAQVATLRGIFNSPRLRIIGGAGTGKTVLAMEAAKAYALEGKRILFLCFNRGLAFFVREVVDGWALPEIRMDVTTFHALCRRAFEELERPYNPPMKEDAEYSEVFWNEIAPLTLLEAMDQGRIEKWDAIVVDEGQDFDSEWWSVLEECISDKINGRMCIFHDPRQDIFGRGGSVPEIGPELSLVVNFRNTRSIFNRLQEIVKTDMTPGMDCPDGVAPVIHRPASKKKALEEIEKLVSNYVEKENIRPGQITIITPHTRQNSLFADSDFIGGYPLVDDPFDRDGAILLTTIGKFKGLESDVVIFADIDPEDERCNANARYVACSRARHVLHEFFKP